MNELQLEKYRHDLAYLKAMAFQTIKDFERFNYILVFIDPELRITRECFIKMIRRMVK